MIRIFTCLSVWLLAASSVWAQATTAVPASPVAVPAAAAQPRTIWSFFGLTKDNLKACRAHLCEHPIGQLLNSMTQPMTLASGGLITPLCPDVPTEEELKNLADPNSTASPAEAAAAKIKADAAGAKARIAAIRYLATVSCHYYPEAEEGLIAGLRGDRIECVRYEAALALGRGCCCTKKTIAALTIAAEGSDKDGNPSETSARVRSAALCALNGCLARVGGNITEHLVPPELPPEQNVQPLVPPEQPPGNPKLVPISYYTRSVPNLRTETLVQRAAKVMAESIATGPSYQSGSANGTGLFLLWNRANEMRKQEETNYYYEAALVRPVRSDTVENAPVNTLTENSTPRAKIRLDSVAGNRTEMKSRPATHVEPVPVEFPQGPPETTRSGSWPTPFVPGKASTINEENPQLQTVSFTTQATQPTSQSSAPALRDFGRSRSTVTLNSSSAVVLP